MLPVMLTCTAWYAQVDASPTRRYDGSGLGLAISKRLCEAMGGDMWAASQGLARGSTFSWNISCRVPRMLDGGPGGRTGQQPTLNRIAKQQWVSD